MTKDPRIPKRLNDLPDTDWLRAECTERLLLDADQEPDDEGFASPTAHRLN